MGRSRTSGGTYDVLSDLRYVLRSLRQRPGLTVAATALLAIAIGATSTVFGVVEHVILRPLPYGCPAGVVGVWSAWKGFDRVWLSYDEWEGWKAKVHAFSDIALYADSSVTLDGESPERLRAATVQANLFSVLGVQLSRGRSFTGDEDRPGGPQVAVLGYELWKRRFGSNPSIVGRHVQLSGTDRVVVGVAPAGFQMPSDYVVGLRTDIYFPLQTDARAQGAVPGPAFPRGGASHRFYAVARLAPGASVKTANAELRTVVSELEKFGYMSDIGFRAFAIPIEEQITGRMRPVLLVVFGAVVLVLLIACANVAGLLLVRGESRRRELAIRIALGAGSMRLGGLLVIESAMLAAVGSVLGLVLSWVSIWLLRRNAPAGLPRLTETSIDWMVLAFAVVLSIVTTLLTVILPLAQASRLPLTRELREGGRGLTVGRARLRWRQILVAGEIAMAVVLVAAAALMIRTVRNLVTIDPGFRVDPVLTMRISTPVHLYPDSIRVVAFWDAVRHRVAAVPGVTAVGAARLLPLAAEMGDWDLIVQGYTPLPNEGTPADWQVVTPGYFNAMGIALQKGRVFGPGDDMRGPLSMIVSRTFEKRYFRGRDALGGRVRVRGDTTKWYTVVGVVDDVRQNALIGPAKPQFYVTLAQFAETPGVVCRMMSLVVRTDGDPKRLISAVSAAVNATDARLAVSDVRTMREIVDAAIGGQRFAAETLGLFGLVALIISAIGIFSIVAQVVAARVHEFGIRAALGAAPAELMSIALAWGLRQAALGLVVGTVAALLLTRVLESLLHGISATDPATFLGVVTITGLVTLIACIWPARRAAGIDPNSVLRAE